MMRRKWMKTLLCVVPVALLGACGGAAESVQEAELGQGTQAVLPAPPANYQLELEEAPVDSGPLSALAPGNAAHYWSEGYLREFDFAWPYSGSPSLDKAAEAVLGLQDYGLYGEPGVVLSFAQFKTDVYSEFLPVPPSLLAAYSNGAETVQVKRYYTSYLVAAGSTGWFNLYVVLFPQSHKVIVFEQTAFET
ncbi:hypothetical protein JRI60_51985 [Archangium violaceum]|uniref:hypothetical protein n=1 Tax=Archangium violaceum TaxID=83451 RepID=UPI00194E99C3|nr:hypothetical protein [Archangium violaceum]QRN97372.1 hypothetical protein JRI60_51985 [Archangium violaceum]